MEQQMFPLPAGVYHLRSAHQKTPTSAELQPFVSTTIFSSGDFLFPFVTIPLSLFTPSFYTLSSTFLHRSSELSRLTDTRKGKKMGYWCSIKIELVILVILIIEHAFIGLFTACFFEFDK
ncbi:hypothetical protein F8388_019216 [Cannabis sativa]|uniref:Uncharacterized protein n=1 Tax=Cannabis sativa TaxID=3483 RepID=A0A7J6F5H7_CANSA|nr:hypothetical protein F8388_019216 [Cannabis sativa]